MIAHAAVTPSLAPDVLVVGGGTVGHLAPGFALAEALRARGFAVAFATPGEAREAAWFEGGETPLVLPAPRRPGGVLGLPAFAGRFGHATAAALATLRRLRPRVVVGLGGWPCVPAALAARAAGVPLVLLAADARPGVAVRRLAPFASRIYVVRESARAALRGDARVLRTGPLLRAAVRNGRADPASFGLEPGRRTLLVVGGSLGARALNEPVARALAAAVANRPDLADRLQVLHAVGAGGADVAAVYRRAGIRHHVVDYLRRMGDAYATSDLVLCRAGAMTCAELAAAGRPAVFVPYPHHADRQQYENAGPLVAAGGAWLLEEAELDARALAERIVPLLLDEETCAAMARRMARQDEDGAHQIADDLGRFLLKGPRTSRPRERGHA